MKTKLLTFLLLLLSAMAKAQVKPVEQKSKEINPVQPGKISITSVPSGSFVKINGESVGKTPLTVSKNKGVYNITFDLEGFETTSKKVSVVAGKTVNCKGVLTEKKLSQKDSLLLIVDELISMKSYYVEDFPLNDEAKNIVSFQNDAAKYARNLKDIYQSSVTKDKGIAMSEEDLKAVITNNVLRMQNNDKLESACQKEAIAIVTNLQPTESNVKTSIQFVYSTLLELEPYSHEQALTSEKTSEIVNLIGQRKLADAAGVIDDSLNRERILKRYILFLKFYRDFYNAGNMRLEELKQAASNK